MGTWGLIQIVFNIFLGLGLFIVAMRVSRQPKDDPRLSRGLQLLQAKIAVLEDLSDRTEVQVNQMTALLEQKCREVQNKIELADRHVSLIRSSMDRSLEVARIFQDKIPHQEIIERKNTLKYLEAARMAHQGHTIEQIVQAVGLPKGEVEFIAKVNRDQLMFSEDQLPDWARTGDVTDFEPIDSESAEGTGAVAEAESVPVMSDSEQARRRTVIETVRRSQIDNQRELVENLQTVQREMDETLRQEAMRRDYSEVFNVPKPPTESLAKLGAEFRKACTDLKAGMSSPFLNDGVSFAELTPPGRPPVASSTVSSGESMEPIDPDTTAPLLDISPDELDQLKKMAAQAQAQAQIQQQQSQALADAQGHAQSLAMKAHVENVPRGPATVPAQAIPTKDALQQAQVAAAATPVSAARSQDPALAAARAQAIEMKKPQPRATVNASAPVIRRVEFPRIKTDDKNG